MTNSSNYAGVLKAARVRSFRWMQFLNAFNDNVYRLVVSLLGRSSGTYLSLAGFIFI